MLKPCHVSLLSDGQHQVLKITDEFALPGTEVLVRKEGNRLIIEPIRPSSLLSLLATLEEITENFSDVDEGLMLLDDITL